MKKAKLPKTAEEAFAILDQTLPEVEKEELAKMDDLIDTHFGLGMWIRNNWLYEGVEYIEGIGGMGQCVPDVDELFLNADDFSEAIIEAYQDYLKNKYNTTMETPTKQNTLYLPIKQVYFDQIIAGTKKEEYREITANTWKKYLEYDETGDWYVDDFYTDEDLEFYGPDLIVACKEGQFPFFFKESIKFLNLAVGYNKVRDTATVEVTSITPMIAQDDAGKDIRFDFDENGKLFYTPDGQFCYWIAVFHLGKIVEKNIVSK